MVSFCYRNEAAERNDGSIANLVPADRLDVEICDNSLPFIQTAESSLRMGEVLQDSIEVKVKLYCAKRILTNIGFFLKLFSCEQREEHEEDEGWVNVISCNLQDQ